MPSQYDIVSMAKRFHIGFYAKCKKCDEMYCSQNTPRDGMVNPMIFDSV